MLIFGFVCGFFLGGACAEHMYTGEDFIDCIILFINDIFNGGRYG